MFNQKNKYALLLLALLSLSACSQRTIVLKRGEITPQQPTKRVYRVERPIIQEEVLIKKNPNLGRVITTTSAIHSTATSAVHGVNRRTTQREVSREIKKIPISTVIPTTTQHIPAPTHIPTSIPNSTPVEVALPSTKIPVPLNNPSLGTTVSVGTTDVGMATETAMSEPADAGKMERIPFPVEEYNRIKKIGRSTVKGSIYLENVNSSKRVMGQNVKLYLNPVTSYSKQWYEESYVGGYKMSKSDPRLFNFLKFTVSDGNGRFNFFGVPNGRYYLVGTISCAEECGLSESKTIRLVEEINVNSGTNSFDLTKNVP